MNTPKISVIVPIYNAEKYLNECIDSILNQDFTDFELLLVDDGSNDNSGQLCDEYAKKDKHIKVFHKNNGGVSSARNLGIDNAKGEYIIFIDSDDYVDVNYLSILMSGGESDLVITGYDSFGYKVENFSFENAEYFGQKRHYKIFCVNVKYRIQNRVLYFFILYIYTQRIRLCEKRIK